MQDSAWSSEYRCQHGSESLPSFSNSIVNQIPTPSAVPAAPEYLATLTPLRGIAALMVVLLHCDLFVAPLWDHRQSLLIKKWYLMVDFFFVLSGFVILHVYGSQFATTCRAVDYRRFVVARFARLYPLHLLTLLWSFAAFWMLKLLKHPLPLEVEAFFAWPGFFTSLAFMQSLGWHDTWAGNGPAWSVSTEWWTYLVFPVLVSLGLARTRLGMALAVVGIVIAYFVIEQWLTVNCPLFADDRLTYMRGTLGTTFDFGLLRCAAGFVLGMLVYRAYQAGVARHVLRHSASFVALGIMIAIGMHHQCDDVLTVAGFALIVLAAASNQSTLRRICGWRPMQRLGDWSYAIYLIHFPLLVSLMVLQDIVNGPPLREASLPPPARPLAEAWGMGLSWCLLTIGVAALVHRFVEVPARSLIKRWFDGRTGHAKSCG